MQVESYPWTKRKEKALRAERTWNPGFVARGREYTDDAASTRARRGSRAFLSGRAAEGVAERLYEAAGFDIAARRWRGDAGEIDLIARRGALTVFAEVKCAGCFAVAAERIRPAQMQRIAMAAEEYAAALPAGRLSDMRIDAVLVNGQGESQLIENAFGA